MSVPPLARALETMPGPPPGGHARGVAPLVVYGVLPAPRAIALINELRRASQLRR